ncbi:MAG TPA: hypothetical protein VK325_00450, partial [Pseudoxanthomonas sp.]|nr:hypothetical protein [Pseudoxanthomonas sp.]
PGRHARGLHLRPVQDQLAQRRPALAQDGRKQVFRSINLLADEARDFGEGSQGSVHRGHAGGRSVGPRHLACRRQKAMARLAR